MSEQYPLYPTLPEPGAQEAQELIERFKQQLKTAAEFAIADLYTDILPHIESDAWTNYRNQMMEGFKDYDNRKIQGEHDFKALRQQIYREFRDDIIKDLDQDNLEEIERLKREIEHLREMLRR